RTPRFQLRRRRHRTVLTSNPTFFSRPILRLANFHLLCENIRRHALRHKSSPAAEALDLRCPASWHPAMAAEWSTSPSPTRNRSPLAFDDRKACPDTVSEISPRAPPG